MSLSIASSPAAGPATGPAVPPSSAAASAGIRQPFGALLDAHTNAEPPTPSIIDGSEAPEDEPSLEAALQALGHPPAAPGAFPHAIGVDPKPAADELSAVDDQTDDDDRSRDSALVAVLIAPPSTFVTDIPSAAQSPESGAGTPGSNQELAVDQDSASVDPQDARFAQVVTPHDRRAEDFTGSLVGGAAAPSAFPHGAAVSLPEAAHFDAPNSRLPSPESRVPSDATDNPAASRGHLAVETNAVKSSNARQARLDERLAALGAASASAPAVQEAAIEPRVDTAQRAATSPLPSAGAAKQAVEDVWPPADSADHTEPLSRGNAFSARDSDARQQDPSTLTERLPVLTPRATPTPAMVAGFEATLHQSRTVSSYAAASAPASIPNEAGVASSIVQSMRLQWQAGVGTAVVQLDPEYLGGVTVTLKVDNGAVTATLHADDPHVRSWLEGNESLLRQGLADQGLSLDRLIVADPRETQEDQPSGERRQPQSDTPPQKKLSRRQTGESTFEVVV